MRAEKETQRLYDFLNVCGPFFGYGTELAEILEMGCPYPFYHIVRQVRTPEWIEEHGWSIAYIGHGSGQKNAYAITDGQGVVHLHPGVQIKTEDTLRSWRKLDAQLDLGLSIHDDYSLESRWMKAASSASKAIVALGEAMLSQ